MHKARTPQGLSQRTQALVQRMALATLLAASVQGCSIVLEDVADLGPTLADLQPAILPEVRAPIASTDLNTIEASYQSALAVTEDPALRQQILVRLADIQMVKGEHNQYEVIDQATNFDDAIAQYNSLLAAEDTPLDAATDERLLYRLAKAYALDARMAESNQALTQLVTRYPNSPYVSEAQFRMAEYAFTEGDYPKARSLYQDVVAAGDSTPFYINALYMVGWAEFKDNQMPESITAFTQVLDHLIPEGATLEDLPDAKRSLVKDTLRVMGITFSYMDGAQTISDTYATLGERHYQHMLYSQLGEFYLSKELYTEAASTYDTYITTFPENTRGPEFALQRLEVLKQGGMGDEVLAGKEAYVARFGPAGDYWANLDETERETQIKPTLAIFLDELSSFYHAKAQALVAAQQDYDAKRKAGNKKVKKPDPARPAFLQAANYYQQFIDVFPQHATVGEKAFLMGEAYVDAGELESAVATYQKVAFEWVDLTFGARAGYNAIVTLSDLIQTEQDELMLAQMRAQKTQMAIDFADFYPGEPQAAPVLAEAANTLFAANEFERAYPLAVRITEWTPAPEIALRKTAWLIIAHIHFDKAEYAQADAAYREVLARLAPDSPERASVTERIAASLFQGAEQMVAAGEMDAAINQFLSIEAVAPGHEIAIKGQYEAGNYYMEQKNWQAAEGLFSRFRTRYPNHALSNTLAPKFAVIYQELEMWDLAAGALTTMAQNAEDPDTKRQTLYLAAELYQKSGRTAEAMTAYQNYLKAYPEPFDLATEARYQLLQMATAQGSRKQHNYWLTQLIEADKKAGSQTTERAHYLAASASAEFALEEFNRFESIKLTLPIKKSLGQKKKALERTLDAYKKVIDYGVGEFVTEANYRIGNVYSQLSRDLLNSERPKGLDDLAMEQYEILLEEQAYPFEEKSIDLLAANAERAWDGFYDDWVKRSLKELAKLLPARYGKQETTAEVSHGLH